MLKKTILAVDDEPEVLTLLEKRLVSVGYGVLTATNGTDALQIAKDKSPDLIILDILMPDMDGSQTAALLHAEPKTKDIPILFLTCLFTKREQETQGHEAGKNFFIAKPYEPKELLGEISEILEPRNRP